MNLTWHQYVMIADEPFPGQVEGFQDDGRVSVNFDGSMRLVWPEDITWRGSSESATLH